MSPEGKIGQRIAGLKSQAVQDRKEWRGRLDALKPIVERVEERLAELEPRVARVEEREDKLELQVKILAATVIYLVEFLSVFYIILLVNR